MTNYSYPKNPLGYDFDEMNFASDPEGRNTPVRVHSTDNSDVMTLTGKFLRTVEWGLPATPWFKSVVAVVEKDGKEWGITISQKDADKLAVGNRVRTNYRPPAPVLENSSAAVWAQAVAMEYHEPKIIGDFHSFPMGAPTLG